MITAWRLCRFPFLALFDWINVVAAAAPGRGYDYRLDGTVEYRGAETVDLRFRLVDKADETVVWSRPGPRAGSTWTRPCG